ncbi:MAG: outer membrane protein transport protein [Myxococcota bacterium]
MPLRDFGSTKAFFMLYASIAFSGLATPRPVRANPEPPGVYGARASAMAGAVVADVADGSSMYHNPAGLANLQSLNLSLAATPLLVRYNAPLAGPGSERDSGPIIAPLLMVGGGYRVHRRLTLGVGAYVQTGFGGGFQDVPVVGPYDQVELDKPQDQTVVLVVWELATAAAFNISDQLRVGISARLPFARQEVSMHQEILPDLWQPVDQSVRGVGIPGVLLGLQYEPHPRVHLGFVYRSKTYIDMSGTTKFALSSFGNQLSFDTNARWNVPHMIRGGGAFHFLNERLIVTVEGRVQFHREANRRQIFRLPDVPIESLNAINVPFDWKNVYQGLMGAEFWVIPNIALRVGASAGNSATPSSTHSVFTPPPGYQLGAYGGIGLRTDSFDVGGAFSWGGGRASVSNNHPQNCAENSQLKFGCAGDYRVDSYFFTIGINYFLD